MRLKGSSFVYSRRLNNFQKTILEQIFMKVSRLFNKIEYGTYDFFRTVEVETVASCNRRCGYCPVSKYEDEKKKYMDRQIFNKIVDDLSSINFRGELNFSGYGEPLLDSRIFELISYARRSLDKKTMITINTNGDFLDVRKIKHFSRLGVRLYVTLHGPSDNDERFIRRYSEFKNVFIRQNINESNLTSRGGLVKVKNKQIKKICVHAPLMLKINSEGDVVICADDFHSKNKFGDVMTEPLIDIWNKPDFKRIRDNLRKGKYELEICKHCFTK
ncbi:MAG: radical SAM/SPASM domain-containing protein [Candidatus Woesearchaeota archaeon]